MIVNPPLGALADPVSQSDHQRLSNLTLRGWESSFDGLFQSKREGRAPGFASDAGMPHVPAEAGRGSKSFAPSSPEDESTRSDQRELFPSFDQGQASAPLIEQSPVEGSVTDAWATSIEAGLPQTIENSAAFETVVDEVGRDSPRTVRAAWSPDEEAAGQSRLTVFVDDSRAEVYVRDAALSDQHASQIAALVQRGHAGARPGQLKIVLNGTVHRYGDLDVEGDMRSEQSDRSPDEGGN